jgi:hypothetical protein
MNLSISQKLVLHGLLEGATLKAHRYLDGTKVHTLHFLDGSVETLRRSTVESLKEAGFIASNKKFPAATYLLTERGRQTALSLGTSPETRPVSPKNYR